MSRPFGTIVKPFEERFWVKVDKSCVLTSCWLWTAGVDGGGYGQIRKNGYTVKAHREMWILTYGPIPDSLNVLHKCDNPPCVNPDHLWLGTQKDNADDMVAKGRHRTWTDPACLARGDRNGSRTHPESRPRGNRHPRLSSLFCEQDIIEIRRIFDTRFDAKEWSTGSEVIAYLADKYLASQSIITAIVYRQRWKNIP